MGLDRLNGQCDNQAVKIAVISKNCRNISTVPCTRWQTFAFGPTSVLLANLFATNQSIEMRQRQTMSDRLSPDVRLIFFSSARWAVALWAAFIFFPADTAFFWAWVIPQPRSALLLGALYWRAQCILCLALRTDSWQAVQNNIPTLFLFCIVLPGAAMIHWDSLRPYHPMSLLWLTSYYAALLFLPILPRVQNASMGTIREEGARLSRSGWRIWLVVRGVVYLGTALFGFIFAPTLST